SDPISVPEGTRLEDAVSLLDRRRLSELPVVDTSGCPSGLLDVVDLVGADLSANSKNPNHPENKQRKHSSAA
ncbi:MAG: CBS domain-containing protein, partial [Pirellulales bacterium]